MPSGASLPSASRTAGVVIRWPTLRTNSRLRPGRVRLPPSGVCIVAVRVRAARVIVCAALVERLLEIAAHQPEPVGIGRDLVLGIDRGDRILEIDDRRQRRFEQDVGDPRRIVAADRMVAVDHDLDVQAVVAEQQRVRRAGRRTAADRAAPARRVRSAQRPSASGTASSRNALARAITCAPRAGIIAARLRRAGQRVGAVERIVEAAPARIGGVEQEARVEHRHDQLRPRQPRDLVVDIRRCRSRTARARRRDSRSRAGTPDSAAGSCGAPRCARCQSSICACSASRPHQQRAVLRREPREEIAAIPAQNASGAIPVPGSARSSMKRASTPATSSPARVDRRPVLIRQALSGRSLKSSVTPVSAIAIRISASKICEQLRRPRRRPARRAHRPRRGRAARPRRRARASAPRRAPSARRRRQARSARSPTASAIAGKARAVDITPSSCRPPWLETTIPSAPDRRGRARIVRIEDALDHELARPVRRGSRRCPSRSAWRRNCAPTSSGNRACRSCGRTDGRYCRADAAGP